MTEQKQAKTQATPFGEFVLAVKMAFYKRETPEHMKRFCAVNETMAKAVNEYSALCAIAEAADKIKEFCQCPEGGYHENCSCLACDQIEAFLKALAALAKLRS